MTDKTGLPPGQYELDEFPRFGLPQFASRFPKETRQIQLTLTGDVGESTTVSNELRDLPRVDQTSDFHCVTTWTRRSLRWSGFRFADFFERIVVPRARPQPDATFAVLRCQDGYVASLPLADLLADSVLLADTLNGEPLTIAHGAPLRLVAPAHYGYKNAKHISGVEFWRDDRRRYRSAAFRFMVHPRARVAFEERGRGVPGWILRYLYRPLVRPAIHEFRRALDQHLDVKRESPTHGWRTRDQAGRDHADLLEDSQAIGLQPDPNDLALLQLIDRHPRVRDPLGRIQSLFRGRGCA